MDTKFLSAKEVAALLGRSEKWVYSNKAAIPGMFYLGRSYFWDQEVLLGTLKDLATRPAKPGARSGGKPIGDRHCLL